MIEKLHELRSELEGTVLEFFLGKNVIAKIAIFLIFLGVMSFGQLAYVDWLNDEGRMIMIGIIGILVSMIGLYFEKKNSVVFSNVFYILGVYLLFLTSLLSHYTYHLFGYTLMMIINLGIAGISFIYFYKRRTEFLDGMLFVLYTFIVILPLNYDVTYTAVMDLIIVGIVLIGYAFVTSIYWTSFYKTNLWMQVVLFTIFSSFILYYLILYYGKFPRHDFVQILYIIIMIGLLFLTNITFIRYSKTVISILLGSIFLFLVSYLVMNLYDILVYYIEFHYSTTILITLFLLVLPLQIYLDASPQKSTAQMYLVYMIFVGILLSIYAGDNMDNYNRNIMNFIPLCLSMLMLVLFFVKESKEYHIAAIVFSSFSVFKLLFQYTLFGLQPRYEYLWMFVPTFLVMIILLLLPILLKPKIEKDASTTIVLLLTLSSIIPIIYTFIYEWHLFSRILYAWVLVLVLVGFRYIIELNIFHTKYTKQFIVFVLLKIIFVIFVSNFWYFDHHLNQLDDVLFLLFTLLINGYIIKAFHELYHRTEVLKNEEYRFIVYFIAGAIVQSIWIHFYINVTFDKVILSSFFMIASAIGIVIGFRYGWQLSRKIGLGVIYFSLFKFFIYDFFTQDFTTIVRMITYFILGFTLLGISFLYSYLEKIYGKSPGIESQENELNIEPL